MLITTSLIAEKQPLRHCLQSLFSRTNYQNNLAPIVNGVANSTHSDRMVSYKVSSEVDGVQFVHLCVQDGDLTQTITDQQ